MKFMKYVMLGMLALGVQGSVKAGVIKKIQDFISPPQSPPQSGSMISAEDRLAAAKRGGEQGLGFGAAEHTQQSSGFVGLFGGRTEQNATAVMQGRTTANDSRKEDKAYKQEIKKEARINPHGGGGDFFEDPKKSSQIQQTSQRPSFFSNFRSNVQNVRDTFQSHSSGSKFAPKSTTPQHPKLPTQIQNFRSRVGSFLQSKQKSVKNSPSQPSYKKLNPAQRTEQARKESEEARNTHLTVMHDFTGKYTAQEKMTAGQKAEKAQAAYLLAEAAEKGHMSETEFKQIQGAGLSPEKQEQLIQNRQQVKTIEKELKDMTGNDPLETSFLRRKKEKLDNEFKRDVAVPVQPAPPVKPAREKVAD